MDKAEIREAIVEYRVACVKDDAAKFLTENKKKEGVERTQSGLQYQVIKSGEGKSPTKDSTVKVHYTGTLVNGTKSTARSIEANRREFSVSGVIKGWTEALQMMKVGDKWRLFIPPDIAYGAKGSPPAVPPHSVLIFEDGACWR